MNTSTRDKLLNEIEAFLKRHGVKPTVFGQMAVNDAKLVSELRLGADITTGRMDKVRGFMRDFADKAAADKHARPGRKVA
jgi:hypothetical protein